VLVVRGAPRFVAARSCKLNLVCVDDADYLHHAKVGGNGVRSCPYTARRLRCVHGSKLYRVGLEKRHGLPLV
jgi:hypothetical protein